MPTPTYTPLANITLGSSAASVTFSSISQAYRDLVLVISGNTSSSITVSTYFNSDTTAANYSWVRMRGDGTSATSTTGANAGFAAAWTAADGNVSTINIMDYTATDKHKTALVRSSSAGNLVQGLAGRWANTSAITSVQLTFTSSVSGLSAALYGIAA